MKQKNIIPLKDLNLTNRFLFDAVAEDPEAHEAILRIILGREIRLGGTNQTEKELRVSPAARTIRMDVFAMDEEDTVYNTEMQNRQASDLPKRSRYYQSLLDTSLLETGSVDYNELNDSCIIMITTFDPFGLGKYVYTFVPICLEDPACTLRDGTVRIFVSTKGTNEDEVSPELVEFTKYVEDTTDERAEQSDSALIRKIHERVCKVRRSEEMGVRYMQAWEEKIYERREAREEGREEGRKEGLEKGFIKGEQSKLRTQIQKKQAKGFSVEEIADMLEEDVETIQKLAAELEVLEGN